MSNTQAASGKRMPVRLVASLRKKLLLALTFLFLPVFIFLVVDFEIDYQDTMNGVLDSQMASAGFISSQLDLSLGESVSLAEALSRRPSIRNLNADTGGHVLAAESGFQPQYEDMILVDASGQLVVSARPRPNQSKYSLSDQPYFQQVMTTGRPAVSGILNSIITGNTAIFVAAPVTSQDGQPAGAVVLVLSPGFLEERIQKMRLPSGQRVFVYDPTARLALPTPVHGQRPGDVDVSRGAPVAEALQGRIFRGGVREEPSADDRAMVVVPTPKYGWIVEVFTPTDEVHASAVPPLLGRLGLFWGLMAAVAIGGFSLAQRGLIVPLSSLVQRIHAFGQGDLEQRVDIRTGDELETVAGAFNSMAQDIRIRAQALEEREEHYRRIVETASEGIWLVDTENRTTFANARLAEMLDRKVDEILGRSPFDFMEEERRPIARAGVNRRRQGAREQHEFKFRRKDGTDLWAIVSTTPLFDGDGRYSGALAMITDITQRKLAEEDLKRLSGELRDSNQRLIEASVKAQEHADDVERRAAQLDAIIESTGDGLIIYGMGADIVRMNKAAETMTGLLPEERAKPLAERLKILRVETPDGTPVSPDNVVVHRALRGESVSEVVSVHHLRDGRTIWVSSTVAPIQTSDGRQLGAVASLTDITRLHDLERKREDFIRGVTHDLRTPLTAVLGNAQFLLRRAQKAQADDRWLGTAQAIVLSAKRINVMIQDLVDTILMDARELRMDRQPVELSELVSGMLDPSSPVIETGRIKVEMPEDLPPVLADPNRLERVLMNLLSNALKYSAPDSQVLLRSELTGEEVTVAVVDKGKGIAPEDLPHIFEHFHKPISGRKAGGLGLGLFVTKMLVEAHGGRIWVDSELARGTTFYFSLRLSGGGTEAHEE